MIGVSNVTFNRSNSGALDFLPLAFPVFQLFAAAAAAPADARRRRRFPTHRKLTRYRPRISCSAYRISRLTNKASAEGTSDDRKGMQCDSSSYTAFNFPFIPGITEVFERGTSSIRRLLLL